MRFLLVLLAFTTFSAMAQEKRVDVSPGLYEIQLGKPYEPVKQLFGTVTEKDVKTGREYFIMLDPSSTEYTEVLGTKVQKLEVYIENGVIEEIIIVFPKKVSLTSVRRHAVELYGEGWCEHDTKNKESGYCVWRGEVCTLELITGPTSFLKATFSR